ncbi:histidine triad nucleotide-binding protein [bacterium (Candidatus Howlettbacteria) CG_4_10_14_0_8_um_filter_40_9]|nr:MAG: histidine triad nucleotide-binding protein [bacterium (Candidatus Howlettbacteria) CG_4_10_14_0_8_um_filter_40_9]
MDKNCIFCKIASKEISKEFLYESDLVMAFHDINPEAPVHILILPKVHISNINEVQDMGIFGDLFTAAKEIAEKEGVSEKGYRVVINTGKDGGQLVDHLHIHLIGGKKLGSKVSG